MKARHRGHYKANAARIKAQPTEYQRAIAAAQTDAGERFRARRRARNREYHAANKDRKNAAARARRIARGEEYQSARRATDYKNRGRIFELHLRKHYSIDLEDWARLYDAQRGHCALCRVTLRFDRTTCVDHDHATGRVRGLLCRACNIGLGKFKDCAETLSRAAVYVRAGEAIK